MRRFYQAGESVDRGPRHRIVHVERMHPPEATPDDHVATAFAAGGERRAATGTDA